MRFFFIDYQIVFWLVLGDPSEAQNHRRFYFNSLGNIFFGVIVMVKLAVSLRKQSAFYA